MDGGLFGLDPSLVVLLPLCALALSFFCSMVGVSGAFLLLPVQILLLGTTSPSVSATNQLFNVLATPSGILRYLREGRMVWPMALVLTAGSLPGLALGSWLRVVVLSGPALFTWFACGVLLLVAVNMLRAEFAKAKTQGGSKDAAKPAGDFRVRVTKVTLHRLDYDFAGESQSVSVPGLFTLSLVVGVVGGAYGIGGGAIIAPFLVAFFRLPVHSLGAATLFSTFISAVACLLFYSILSVVDPSLAIAPDWTVGILLGIGGCVGMSLGARMQKKVPARTLKKLLFVLILLACAALLFRLSLMS